tara:strand:- start:49 stop:444 length:396 start_codon:yes stop_codon:yes gene_type:complete
MREFWRIKMSNEFSTIKEMLETIDIKINHIEDMVADNRAITIKLVKQGNQIVSFLRQLEADVDDEYEISLPPTFGEFTKDKLNNVIDESTSIKDIQDIVNGLKEKNRELKELEDELEKNKDKITPGLRGES